MDRIDGEQPLVPRKDISYLPPYDAVIQRRQHAVAPLRGFHSQPIPVVRSAPCLTLTGTTGATLCSRRGSHASTFLPPFPRHDFAFRAFRGSTRNGTMETLTPAALTYDAGLPTYLATSSCRSASNHVGCLVTASHHP